MRSILLVLINVSIAMVLATSLMPVAMILAPIVRSEPHIGHTVFIIVTLTFVAANVILWRSWRQR
jgi:hypothetical protein